MHPYEFNLSFRVTHPSNDLGVIYEKINSIPGFIPGRIWKVGDEKVTQSGEKLNGHYKGSYCYFARFGEPQKSEVESSTSAIQRAIDSLSSVNSALQEHTKSGRDLEFVLSLYVDSNSAFIVFPELMQELLQLQIRRAVDIYPQEMKH